ncbi:MAG: hypothetical protein K2K81_00980 [Muribaculaceae bacterium]|nr:hypothetical protein [Muribaculaceae bacterium]
MKKIVIGVSCLLGLIGAGCAKQPPKGDSDVERHFQGDWSTEYLIDNSDMRMRVKEKISFDTLDNKYKVSQVLMLIYPVTIKYADVSYEGTWSADKKYLHGVIDQSTVKNELNSKFEEEPEFQVYKDFVKNSADADMQKDEFVIRVIKDDRIHLIDLDRDVAHDLVRAGQPEATPEADTAK